MECLGSRISRESGKKICRMCTSAVYDEALMSIEHVVARLDREALRLHDTADNDESNVAISVKNKMIRRNTFVYTLASCIVSHVNVGWDPCGVDRVPRADLPPCTLTLMRELERGRQACQMIARVCRIPLLYVCVPAVLC